MQPTAATPSDPKKERRKHGEVRERKMKEPNKEEKFS
jgi:hypothetical protein